MRFVLALLVLIVAPAVHAQEVPALPVDSVSVGKPRDADDVETDGPSPIAGIAGSLAFPQGSFADSTGSTHVGGIVSLGMLRGRLGYGGELAVYPLSYHSERISQDTDMVTTTLLVRAVAYGRYGPRWSGGYAYAEVLAGANVLDTSTRFSGPNQGREGDEGETTLTPALGGGVGLIARLLSAHAISLHAQARFIYGGPASYRIYREGSGGFSERRSGTTMTALSLGLIFVMWDG